MGRRWRAFRQLCPTERLRLIEAAGSIIVIWISLRTLGYGRTRSMAMRTGRHAHARSDAAEADVLANQMARFVDVAANAAPFSTTCLDRSVALWWLLRRHGIHSDLRIGAVQTANGMAAHAWVERQGTVLNDAQSVTAIYSAFDGVW